MILVKIKALKETISFYKVELKKEDLTERERDKYLRALKLIEGLIKRKREARAPGYKKNNYLDSRGGLHVIDKFPGIDFMPYEKERIGKE